MNSLKSVAIVAQNVRVVIQIVVREARNAAVVAENAVVFVYVLGWQHNMLLKQHKFVQDCFLARQFQLSVRRNICGIKS